MNRNVLSRRVLAGVAVAALALAGCSSKDDPATDPSASANAGGIASLTGELKGSGASFPNSYYQEVITQLKDEAKGLTVTYNSIGSGAGKKEFGQGLTDFAGTDSSVKDTDGVAAGSFLYVPTVAAPITVSFNLKGVDKLQLSADTLAKIFQRQIKVWNAPEIATDNPGVTLPATAITVAHRGDASGTTSNFTKYLAAAAPTVWTLGSGDTVAWAADTQAGQKNTGVAQLIKAADGGIGYVDLADAADSGLKFASIKNKDGQFVAPTLEGATAALAGAEVKDDLSYNPLNAAGATAYPITAPTYILVKPKYDDPKKAALVKAFVKYILTDGKDLAAELHYSVLPAELQAKALAQLDKIS
ncbi:phosphate ABC transporter substrate-binding protein PstS [Catellatospora tritici]|uniref:phosphate ABC transporter substrate-binding protein PstS n=1 Tax=Catellatospora tritici TaxID=2851566 RepID=UPI001C2DC6CE|nr:phosphate ABC transporter substrate-binding protein PstS [Catellatospora tritici]MBV1855419.1 phosphate ABC transporter substrate-binding protein PstS [Catellatospora tritici]